jgi:hypothetical protein
MILFSVENFAFTRQAFRLPPAAQRLIAWIC